MINRELSTSQVIGDLDVYEKEAMALVKTLVLKIINQQVLVPK